MEIIIYTAAGVSESDVSWIFLLGLPLNNMKAF